VLKIKQVVLEELRQVLDKLPAGLEIDEDMNLNADLGMSSLQLAELVATLEDRCGWDPFREHVPITEVRTVGDLITAYASHPKNSNGEANGGMSGARPATSGV